MDVAPVAGQFSVWLLLLPCVSLPRVMFYSYPEISLYISPTPRYFHTYSPFSPQTLYKVGFLLTKKSWTLSLATCWFFCITQLFISGRQCFVSSSLVYPACLGNLFSPTFPKLASSALRAAVTRLALVVFGLIASPWTLNDIHWGEICMEGGKHFFFFSLRHTQKVKINKPSGILWGKNTFRGTPSFCGKWESSSSQAVGFPDEQLHQPVTATGISF